jgi:hypothetical protein
MKVEGTGSRQQAMHVTADTAGFSADRTTVRPFQSTSPPGSATIPCPAARHRDLLPHLL